MWQVKVLQESPHPSLVALSMSKGCPMYLQPLERKSSVVEELDFQASLPCLALEPQKRPVARVAEEVWTCLNPLSHVTTGSFQKRIVRLQALASQDNTTTACWASSCAMLCSCGQPDKLHGDGPIVAKIHLPSRMEKPQTARQLAEFCVKILYPCIEATCPHRTHLSSPSLHPAPERDKLSSTFRSVHGLLLYGYSFSFWQVATKAS